MMDLMYFGYGYDDDATKFQADFINEVKEVFPDVVLKNAYDQFKGYRQEVWLDESKKDDYYSFLIGKGWFKMSLTMQLVMRTDEKKEDFKKWFKLAKKQYPEAFKPEALKEDK
jgi:hypothetical protein